MNTIKINLDKPIAMIDDNIVDFEAASRFIKKSQLRNKLIHFISGEDFIAFLKENASAAAESTPALALMDINMLGLNGHQTTEIIRNMPEYRDMPVIYMFTSSSDFKDQDKARNAGANGFLVKPFSPQEYIELFNKFA